CVRSGFAQSLGMRASVIPLLLLTLLANGCSLAVQPYRPSERKEHVFNTNYELGKARTAYVGEPVLVVKDYREIRRTSPTVSPSADFRVSQALTPWHSGSRQD